MAKDKEVMANAKAKDAKPKQSIFKKVGRFFKDLRSEFKKIVWPTKKQVINNTGVVLVFMGITAVAIWGLDFIFIQAMKLLFK